eukprot:4151978-Amphidinium_carterae.1
MDMVVDDDEGENVQILCNDQVDGDDVGCSCGKTDFQSCWVTIHEESQLFKVALNCGGRSECSSVVGCSCMYDAAAVASGWCCESCAIMW